MTKGEHETGLVLVWLSNDGEAKEIASEKGPDGLREYVYRELGETVPGSLFYGLAYFALDDVNWSQVAEELAELD